jgi:hypothetical protein
MVSSPKVYPGSHHIAVERVMRVIDLIAARRDISDEDVVVALVEEGIDEVDAELLVRFVPCAFSFALLKLLGVGIFPSTYQVQNSAGQWVEFPLSAEHYFSAALGVGYEVTTHGYTERVSKATFEALTLRSVEMRAVNEYFRSGGTREELAGSTIDPPTFLGVTAEKISANR